MNHSNDRLIHDDWISGPKVQGTDLKKYVIHSTMVDPKVILEEGVKPFSSKESKTYKNNPLYNYPSLIYATNSYKSIWFTKYTKGSVIIDTSMISNLWWYDPHFYNEKISNGKYFILTNEKIPSSGIVGILHRDDLINIWEIGKVFTRKGFSDNEYLDIIFSHMINK
jgi:hypothetical protein